MKFHIHIIILLFSTIFSFDENNLNKFTVSRIHYNGGGDWYADPSSIPNLLEYINKNTVIRTQEKEICIF